MEKLESQVSDFESTNLTPDQVRSLKDDAHQLTEELRAARNDAEFQKLAEEEANKTISKLKANINKVFPIINKVTISNLLHLLASNQFLHYRSTWWRARGRRTASWRGWP